MIRAQIAFSDFVFLNLPTAIYILYGISMAISAMQFHVVGLYPTLFRVFAWQVCLVMALCERKHLRDRIRLEEIEDQFGKALDTIGIRRSEYEKLETRVRILEKLVTSL